MKKISKPVSTKINGDTVKKIFDVIQFDDFDDICSAVTDDEVSGDDITQYVNERLVIRGQDAERNIIKENDPSKRILRETMAKIKAMTLEEQKEQAKNVGVEVQD